MYPTRWLTMGLLLTFLVSPGAGQDAKSGEKAAHYPEPYFPIGAGSKWTYRVIDRKAPKSPDGKKLYVIVLAEREVVFDNKKKNKDGQEYTERVVGFDMRVFDERKPDDKKLLQEQVMLAENGVYRVSSAGKQINPPLCLLKKDSQTGTTWTCASQSENAKLTGKFIVAEEPITVDIDKLKGTYKSIVVRSNGFQVGGQDMHVETWYLKGYGMVRQHVKVGNHDVVLELEKYEPAQSN